MEAGSRPLQTWDGFKIGGETCPVYGGYGGITPSFDRTYGLYNQKEGMGTWGHRHEPILMDYPKTSRPKPGLDIPLLLGHACLPILPFSPSESQTLMTTAQSRT